MQSSLLQLFLFLLMIGRETLSRSSSCSTTSEIYFLTTFRRDGFFGVQRSIIKSRVVIKMGASVSDEYPFRREDSRF